MSTYVDFRVPAPPGHRGRVGPWATCILGTVKRWLGRRRPKTVFGPVWADAGPGPIFGLRLGGPNRSAWGFRSTASIFPRNLDKMPARGAGAVDLKCRTWPPKIPPCPPGVPKWVLGGSGSFGWRFRSAAATRGTQKWCFVAPRVAAADLNSARGPHRAAKGPKTASERPCGGAEGSFGAVRLGP